MNIEYKNEQVERYLREQQQQSILPIDPVFNDRSSPVSLSTVYMPTIWQPSTDISPPITLLTAEHPLPLWLASIQRHIRKALNEPPCYKLHEKQHNKPLNSASELESTRLTASIFHRGKVSTSYHELPAVNSHQLRSSSPSLGIHNVTVSSSTSSPIYYCTLSSNESSNSTGCTAYQSTSIASHSSIGVNSTIETNDSTDFYDSQYTTNSSSANNSDNDSAVIINYHWPAHRLY
ncbi:hypothetical protein BDF19DRAFT_468722 [Syncephalis fuscata]|nr:hypothetical protein BDF19DRAFT_468722 [Syncephalis fuscata]